MQTYSCFCLNLTIDLSSVQVCSSEDSLSLDDKTVHQALRPPADLQAVSLVGTVVRKDAVHESLQQSRLVGNWVLHSCLICQAKAYAVNDDQQALVNPSLPTGGALDMLRKSPSFSSTFGVVVEDRASHSDIANIFDENDTFWEAFAPALVYQAKEAVNRERIAMEERVKSFVEAQRANFTSFKENLTYEMLSLSVKNSKLRNDSGDSTQGISSRKTSTDGGAKIQGEQEDRSVPVPSVAGSGLGDTNTKPLSVQEEEGDVIFELDEEIERPVQPFLCDTDNSPSSTSSDNEDIEQTSARRLADGALRNLRDQDRPVFLSSSLPMAIPQGLMARAKAELQRQKAVARKEKEAKMGSGKGSRRSAVQPANNRTSSESNSTGSDSEEEEHKFVPPHTLKEESNFDFFEREKAKRRVRNDSAQDDGDEEIFDKAVLLQSLNSKRVTKNRNAE